MLFRLWIAISGILHRFLIRLTFNHFLLSDPYKEVDNDTPPKKKKQPKLEQFYTEKRNNTGSVYRSYPKTSSVRKAVPEPIFPDVEERISSKQVKRKHCMFRTETFRIHWKSHITCTCSLPLPTCTVLVSRYRRRGAPIWLYRTMCCYTVTVVARKWRKTCAMRLH